MSSSPAAPASSATPDFVVKATSVGLDPDRKLQSQLPAGYMFEEYDPARPLVQQVSKASAFLTRSIPITREVIDAAPALRLIQRPGAHVEAVDVNYASRLGIPVCHIPPSLTPVGRAVAEHTLFLILALAKRYAESQRSIAARAVGTPATSALAGKTLGLVGIGRTARDLVPMARAIGMDVIALKRTAEPGLRSVLELDWLGTRETLPELLARSDVVSIHLPLTAETHRLFNHEVIALMKPGSLLVNTARAEIIAQDALLEALKRGHLAGAALDVAWSEPLDPHDPILAFPNVVVTPHIAGATAESRDIVCDLVVENVQLVASGRPPKFIVNKPSKGSNGT